MPYEFAPRTENSEKLIKRMREIEFEMSKKHIEQAEKDIELWQGAFDKVWDDKEALEKQEGPLDPEDARLTSIKICAMRLDEAKTILRDLKRDNEKMVQEAGLN